MARPRCSAFDVQAALQDTLVSANAEGCCAADLGALALDECVVSTSTSHGLRALSGGVLRLCGGVVKGNGAHGVHVEHRRSELSAEAVRVEHNALSGVCATRMARATLRRCRVTQNKVAGVQATVRTPAWRVTMRGSQQSPCSQHECAGQAAETRVDLDDCHVGRNGVLGVFVTKGATGTIKNCAIHGNLSCGCEVRDRGSVLHVAHTHFAHNGLVGAYVHSVAAATFTRQCSMQAGEVCPVLCGGREGLDLGGGIVALSDCTIEDAAIVRRLGGRVYKCEETAFGLGAVDPLGAVQPKDTPACHE